MIRTQVQLTESQLRSLKQLSAETGRSLADLVRLGVDVYLGSERRINRDEQVQRALRAAGRFSSGKRDVSAHHDRHLAEAYRE